MAENVAYRKKQTLNYFGHESVPFNYTFYTFGNLSPERECILFSLEM